MTTVEAAPSVSYKLSDHISIAGGVRFVYGKATVNSNGVIIANPSANPEYVMLSRAMDGDTFEYGYNLAVSAKPIDNLTLALTYR